MTLDPKALEDVAELALTLERHAVINEEMGRVVTGQVSAMREAAALISALSADNERLREDHDAWADERVEILSKGTAWRARAEASESRVRELEAALADLRRCSNAIVGANPYDDEAQEAFEMFNIARDHAHVVLARSVAKEAGNNG